MRLALPFVLLGLVVTMPARAQAPAPSASAAPACTPSLEHAKKAEEVLRSYVQYVDTAELDRLNEADDISGLRETHRRGVNWITALLCDATGLTGQDLADARASAKTALDAAQRVEAALKVETDCEATDKCMAGRVCETLAIRDDLRAQIRHERSNPAGVVDLVRLHDLGESLQATEDLLKARQKRFAAARKKPFAASMCPKA